MMADFTDTTFTRVNSTKNDQFSNNNVANQVEINSGDMSVSHVCFFCGTSLPSKYDLKIHMKTHSVSGENTYQCIKCEKVFKYLNKLEKHMKSHTSDLPYKCIHCGDSFKQEFRLTHHVAAHTGEKPYKCNLCDNGFNRLIDFKEHFNTHVEKNTFICSLCDKTYLNKSSFLKHMDVAHSNMDVAHSIEFTPRAKPFQCNHCDKAFMKKQSLKRHMVIHMAVIPYQCSLCDKGFVMKSDHSRHMEIHRDQRVNANSTISKLLPEKIVESHLETDAEQEIDQCNDGESVDEAYSIKTEPSINNAETVDCDIVDTKFEKSVTWSINPGSNIIKVQTGCQSSHLDLEPKAAKKKKKNVIMNPENCTTFSQAYALACLTERGDKTSFHRVMKQYSVANNLPVVIHPTPDKDIIEFYSKKIVSNE